MHDSAVRDADDWKMFHMKLSAIWLIGIPCKPWLVLLTRSEQLIRVEKHEWMTARQADR
jgi:hypothetical protein